MVAELVFIEINAIQGTQFHPILLDLGHLGDVEQIRALVDYQVPCPPTVMWCALQHHSRIVPLVD